MGATPDVVFASLPLCTQNQHLVLIPLGAWFPFKVIFFFLSMACIVLGDDSVKSVRRKSGLVNIGASKMEVTGKCGDPLHKDVLETTSKRTNQDFVKVEEWGYNFGPGDFLYVFQFAGSSLVDIRRGERGF
jgi:hypothetical protein